MNKDGTQTNLGNSVLEKIHEDMKVYDREGNHIGEVDQVYLGSASEEMTERGKGPATPSEPLHPAEGTVVDVLADAFSDEELPETLRNRLLQHGFIRLGAGALFGKNRYALPDQIARVDEHVHLNVTKDKLIRPE